MKGKCLCLFSEEEKQRRKREGFSPFVVGNVWNGNGVNVSGIDNGNVVNGRTSRGGVVQGTSVDCRQEQGKEGR